MPKPTLLQSLLGRPSQSYAFPPQRQYYSARDEFARAAAALSGPLPLGHTENALSQTRGVDLSTSTDGHQKRRDALSSAYRSSSNRGIPLPPAVPSPQRQITSGFNPSDHQSDDDSGDDVFYTPFSSPPTSMLIDPLISSVPREPPFLPSPDDKSTTTTTATNSSSSSSSSHSALSCSTPPTSDELHAALAALQKRPASQSRSKRILAPPKSYTYTDEDWAEECRWFVPPSASASKRCSADLDATPPSALTAPLTNQPKHRPRPRTVVGRPITSRMTALLEEDEDGTDDLGSSPTPSHVRGPFPSSLSRTNSITSNSHGVRSSSRASHTRPISLSSRFVELPQFPSSSVPTAAPGYMALTLPRASYCPEDPWRSLGSGHVDLARDGRAQVSMVSIEVVRGAAAISFFLPPGFRKRNSAPRLLKHDLAGTLALASHGPPPSIVPNSAVVVHVYAVGLEGLDRQILMDKLAVSDAGGKGATGFVPGRGVFGRVVECGLEVSTETLRKGEWVIGLLDAKKCGALSEFVLLDRHRVHRAPQPTVPIPLPMPTPDNAVPSFSLESLALLPVLGVPAYRAVRTYTASKSPLSSGGTALVLRGQDGAGGLATLMLRAIGVNVIVQVEPSVVGYNSTVTASSQPHMLFSTADDKALGTGIPRRLQEVCARLRAWGVEGICVGAPLAVIHALDVDIDFVLDTIGGHEIWDAARDLLERGTAARGPAQFTTLVGDARSGKAVPTMQDNWRAGVRSLKRAVTVSRGSGGLNWGRPSPSSKVESRGSIPGWLAPIPPTSPPLSSTSTSTSPSPSPSSSSSSPSPPVTVALRRRRWRSAARSVDYSWVSCVADVDFEGGDLRDALAALLTMPALQHLAPDTLLGLGGEYGAGRVLPFERAPEAFGGPALHGGGTAIIRIVL
ncbi:hypothetical protein F5148DRAFT_1372919 [Russula earlei]|uniref:Uncharacterized protein n=1 Tax=Russula earlei TaxID=71964 RepID=A0ACC0UPC4_9AGAM|nr:hypothetical protein F5148DRAFT_1372919 [Russula earlei]